MLTGKMDRQNNGLTNRVKAIYPSKTLFARVCIPKNAGKKDLNLLILML